MGVHAEHRRVVGARILTASACSDEVAIRGHTENKRTVEVRAETQGRVVERPVERGTLVETGICYANSPWKIARHASAKPRRR